MPGTVGVLPSSQTSLWASRYIMVSMPPGSGGRLLGNVTAVATTSQHLSGPSPAITVGAPVGT